MCSIDVVSLQWAEWGSMFRLVYAPDGVSETTVFKEVCSFNGLKKESCGHAGWLLSHDLVVVLYYASHSLQRKCVVLPSWLTSILPVQNQTHGSPDDVGIEICSAQENYLDAIFLSCIPWLLSACHWSGVEAGWDSISFLFMCDLSLFIKSTTALPYKSSVLLAPF